MSWLLVFVLISLTLAFGYFPLVFSGYATGVYLVVGAFTAVAFFTSILIHEVSHSIVARAWGIPVKRVTLFIFGGVSQIEEEPSSPGREFGMAIAGPLASLVLGAIFFLLFTIASASQAPPWIAGPLEYLALINTAVAIFNLLPAYPLDGGRVLHSLLWRATGNLSRATRWAARTGQVFGFVMIALAFFQVASGQMVNGLWMGLLGWFLVSLAGQTYQRQVITDALQAVRIGDLMTSNPLVAPGDITLETLAHDYFLAGHHSRYPVVENGQVVGLISLRRARLVPRGEWPLTRVADVTDRDIAAVAVDPDSPADAAISKLLSSPDGALLAVQEGRLVGIVTRADVVSMLHRRSELTA